MIVAGNKIILYNSKNYTLGSKLIGYNSGNYNNNMIFNVTKLFK